jgi:hypothetical protein
MLFQAGQLPEEQASPRHGWKKRFRDVSDEERAELQRATTRRGIMVR